MSERTERSEGHERMPGQPRMSERTERSEGHERSGDLFGSLPLAAAITHWVAARAGCPAADIDPDQPLVTFGLSSVDAVELAGRLSDLLGRPVPATLAWEHPTINAVLTALADDAPPATLRAVSSPPAERVPSAVPDDAVAIVGIGCRLPGASDPARLWRLFSDGRDAVTTVPPQRWPQFSDGTDRTAAAMATTSTHGGFLDDIESFDAGFFGITATEARLMDPQQRILLEVTSEALQHAAVDPASLRGSRTGVYVGICASEYSHLTSVPLDQVDGWTVTGSALSIAANRLSYLLDLRGPSMAVDTACSSSLVALHLAVRSLRSAESDLAVVGGVNVLLSPAITLAFGRGGGLAPGGRCRPFDADAEGMVRAEGCGVLILKRYADAQRDGDRIIAVVRGSAVNSDGRSNGMVAPNPQAQEAVLLQAYADAGVDPSEVDYVEAHGTGTPLGDPVEATALGRALGVRRDPGDPLLIGSAKSNLGHLEAAAGIASVIKAALSLWHGEIPPSLHFDRANPLIPFDEFRLRVVGRGLPYPQRPRPARAGVSAFGFGGTNAHVVLEAAQPHETEAVGPLVVPEAGQPQEPEGGRLVTGRLSVLSDLTGERVRRHAAALADWLDGHDGATVGGVVDTLARRGRRGPARAVVRAVDRQTLSEGLRALASGAEHPAVVTGDGDRGAGPGLWMFSGYGTHWTGMGLDLIRTEPAFAGEVDRLDPLFVRHLGWSLRAGLESESALTVVRAQPLTFGVQLALAALWRAQGVRPAGVLGHSMGEVAAAVVAGALTRSDGVRVIGLRARLLGGVGPGAMAVVELSEEDFGRLSAGLPDVHIAVVGGPRHLVVTGEAAAVATLAGRVNANGGLARTLTAEGAGHSPAVDHLLPQLLAGLAGLHPRATTVPFYSTAEPGRRDLMLDADYWARNLRRPVRLSAAVDAAAADGHRLFLELSPHPVLSHPVTSTLIAGGLADPLVVASLSRGNDAAFHRNLAVLHANGLPTPRPADATTTPSPTDGGGRRPEILELPAAPWQQSRHWHDTTPPPRRGTTARRATLLDSLVGVAWSATAAPASGSPRPACLLGTSGDALLAAARSHRGAPAGTRTAGHGRVPADALSAVSHVVLLAAPTPELPDPHTAQRLAHSIADAVRSTLDAPGRRLWLVTRGAAAVRPGEVARPDGVWIRGLVRSLSLEQPQLRASWLDLDAEADADAAATVLWAEVGADGPHDEIAWRAGRRHTAHLVPVAAQEPRVEHAVRPGAAYVITGGFRGIGLRIARWLADRGAGRVVLAGRSGAPPESAPTLDAIRAGGVEVVEARGDLTAPGAAALLVRMARSGGTRLAGVAHGAAVLDDRLAADVGAADLHRVWAPKVHGAWLLQRAVTAAGAGAELDWWVSLSSAAALLGSPGQTVYAGANAWLDGFAAWQRAQGIPAWSVNWGPWAQVGGATAVALGGIEPIRPDDGIAALEGLLHRAPTTAGVLRLDVHAAAAAFPEIARLPFFDRVVDTAPVGRGDAVPPTPDAGQAATAVRGLPYPQAVQAITDRLGERVAAVLGLAGSPRSDVALPDLGLDSLAAMRVKHLVETDFGVALPTALLVRGGTLRELSEHLAEAVGLNAPEEPESDVVDIGQARRVAADSAPTRRGLAEVTRLPFVASEPEPVGPRDSAERLVLRTVQDVLGVSDVGVTDRLGELADDGPSLARVAERLRTDTGADIAVHALRGEPTAEALAHVVRAADQAEVDRNGLIRPLRADGDCAPLFLAHPAGGTTAVYRDLTHLLGDEQPVYGLERLVEAGAVPDRATRYLDAIRAVQPTGPYRLGGWSFGGALAYELACQLTAKGETVEVLALIDAGLPQPLPPGRAAELLRERFLGFAAYLRQTYGALVDVQPRDLAGLDEQAQFELVMRRMAAAGVADRLPPAILAHQLTSHQDTRSLDDYRPGPYAGPVVLYRSTRPTPWNVTDERYEHTDPTRGWDQVCTDLRCVPVDAHHLNLLDPPAVHTVAADLRRIL